MSLLRRLLLALVALSIPLAAPVATALAAPVRKEAVGVVEPRGEPQPEDELLARASALRIMIRDHAAENGKLTPAGKRAFDAAVDKADLSALRAVLSGVETVVNQRRRTGYLEMRVTANVDPDAVAAWCAKHMGDAPLKKLRIMVIIPEQHLARPIPDPAGETEILRALIAEGFRLVDQKQVEAIRDRDLVKRAMKNDPKELIATAKSLQAELLLYGEAFSQDTQASREVVGNSASCAARIEVRLVLCDTGEIISAHDAEGGAIHLSPAVAAKAAIRNAATKLAAKVIDDLMTKGTGQKAYGRIKVVLLGADFEQKTAFTDVLESLKEQITGVDEQAFDEHRAEMDISTELAPAKLASLVFAAATDKGLALKVVGQTGRTCVFQWTEAPAAATAASATTQPAAP